MRRSMNGSLAAPPGDGIAEGGAGSAPLSRLLGEATRQLAASLDPEEAERFSPRAEVLALAAGVLGLTREAMLRHPDQPLAEDRAVAFRQAVRRRMTGEPLARITGWREFWDSTFLVSPETLIPRPDSETLIEAALEAFPERMARLQCLDLGTGSGCLLLSLLRERPNACGLGVDLQPGAVVTARRNACRLGLASRAGFIVGDWASALSGPFDLILVNPPYVAEQDRATLAPAVRDHDPALALFAGSDGLSAYGRLLPQLPAILARDGRAILEIGLGQGPAVARMAERSGLVFRQGRADLAGRERALILSRLGGGTPSRAP